MPRTGVIIVAGGRGLRMGSELPKQFMPLCGTPVLVHTIRRFLETLPGAQIVVALPEGEIGRWQEIAIRFGLTGTHEVCAGGATRFESVSNALARIGKCDLIAVHDGARPLVTGELILRTIDTATAHGTAVPSVQPDDSFRTVGDDGLSAPVDRSALRAVQTPQVFRCDLLRKAYETAYDPRFTDDASVVEHSGTRVTLCEGEPSNIKITAPFHLRLAEALLTLQNG